MTESIVKLVQRIQPIQSLEDTKHFIYMHSKWLDDVTHLEVLLTPSNNSYQGTLNHDEIRSAAQDLELPYDDFFKECRDALITQLGRRGFDYEVDEEQTVFKLWRSMGIDTLYLEVPLRKVPNNNQLLDAAISLPVCPCQQAKGAGGDGDGVKFSPERKRAYKESVARYEQYVIDTRVNNRMLLQKFTVLINNKKQRIQNLLDMVEDYKANTVPRRPLSEELPIYQPKDRKDKDDYDGATQPCTQIVPSTD